MEKSYPALLIILLIFVALPCNTQEVVTAEGFFESVSEAYGSIIDYEANIRITQSDLIMEGMFSYKYPNLIRIDFTNPTGQVIVSDGSLLTVYYPKLEVIFEQNLLGSDINSSAMLASRKGLNFLQRNYAISYVGQPNPTPLDEGSRELVVKLRFTSRSASEGFRQLEMAVAAGNLIRRITGITVGFEEYSVEFFNVRTNQNIPDERFNYDSPPFANVYKDFLFKSTD